MKERPYIYVIQDWEQDVVGAYYSRAEAEAKAQELALLEDPDPIVWDAYYHITGVQCE